MTGYDLIVRDGLWFDGSGAAPRTSDIGVIDGEVAAISRIPLRPGASTEVIDARGQWVMPGFIDVHTHYDVELLAAPALTESVRHGVTTAVIGNCSLSTISATDTECADIFSRVEAVPREVVLAALRDHRTWSDPRGYAKAVDRLDLGLNVGAFLGQSDMRVAVMGMDRAVDEQVTPTSGELSRMTEILHEALDAGFLGMSATTNPVDKLDGELYRSRAMPATFVKGREFRTLNNVLRARGRVLQSTPEVSFTPNLHKFFLAAGGRFRRRRLKVSLLAAADTKAYPHLIYFMLYGTPLINRLLTADFRWQHLPVPFTVYADGMDLVVFEEFGSGAAALHIADELERNELLRSRGYRRWFRRDYEDKVSPRIWHRDLHEATIVDCPDRSLIAKSFGRVADERGIHPADAFLDLVLEYGRALRWRTTVANDRPKYLNRLATSASVHLGFGDAGAHLRNLAYYNYHVRLLERVKAAQGDRTPFLTVERAVHRLTGELADWYNLDAGHLRVGDRADIAILDPDGLDASVHGMFEREIPAYDGLRRMVNNSDKAVTATIVNGCTVFRDGQFAPGLGERWGPGRFLRAGAKVRGKTIARESFTPQR